MSDLAKLKASVENQAKSLDPAQREFVLAVFETYEWNAKYQKNLEEQLEAAIGDEWAERDIDAEGKVFRQRHQIVAEQCSVFSNVMRWLKGTASKESALDAFIDG